MMAADPHCTACGGSGEFASLTETGFMLTILCDCIDAEPDVEDISPLADTMPPASMEAP